MPITLRPLCHALGAEVRGVGHLRHSDMAFTPVPALGSLLRGITIAPVGGDTMFTNTTLACETLSAGMKKMIADLQGIHTGRRKIVDMSAARIAERQRYRRIVRESGMTVE